MSRKSSSSTVATPLSVFCDLAQLAAVTSAEQRIFAWLLQYWAQVDPPTHLRHRLSLRFEGGSQLAVHWTGNPQSNRRTIIVAHTDCEGYVLLAGAREPDGQHVRVLGVHPNGGPVEAFREGAPVLIVVGDGNSELDHMSGRVVEVNRNLTGEEQKGAVVIRTSGIPMMERGSSEQHFTRLLAELASPTGIATAIHVFRQGRSQDQTALEHPVIVRDPGDVFASYVDNAAGVAVATTAVSRIVRDGNEGVNASILYTSGEEGGFLGLLRFIDENAHELRAPTEDVLWLVVDSSDQQCSERMRLTAAASRTRASRGGRSVPLTSEVFCPSTCCAIRVGDKGTNYDVRVARMLVQAAMDARRHFAVDSRPLIGRDTLSASTSRVSANPAPTEMDPIDQLRHSGDWTWLGVAGVFGGGWCEASVLTHLADLLQMTGLEIDDTHGAIGRVGSIAIPILNYRQISSARDTASANDDRKPGAGEFLPERTHVSALNSAYLVLQEACDLHMTNYYPSRTKSPDGTGYRGWLWLREGLDAKPKSREDLVATWHRRMREKALQENSRLQHWVKTTGLRMLQPR